MTPDPLTVACSHCDAKPGQRCMAVCDWARKPHAARRRLALVLAAHADPALDAFFKMRNPCGVCGVPGLPQRHRVVDSIAGALEAGECEQEVMEELGVSLDQVMAVTAWAAKYPGAWR